MKVTIKTYSAAETCFILRRQLGPIYAWADRLVDMIRGKVSSGPILRPVVRSEKAGMKRPVYLDEDIARFILAFRKLDPCAQKDVAPQAAYFAIDSTDPRAWRYKGASPTTPAACASVPTAARSTTRTPTRRPVTGDIIFVDDNDKPLPGFYAH